MTPHETEVLSQIRDGMRDMAAESRDRSRVLQNLKVIVDDLQRQITYLERRIAVLERPDYAA